MLTVVRCGGREAGEYSVTAENRLGNSTRDWRLRVRPPPPPPVPAPAPQVVSPAAPSASEKVEVKSCNTEEVQQQHRQAPPATERRPESDSPRSAVDPAPPPGSSQYAVCLTDSVPPSNLPKMDCFPAYPPAHLECLNVIFVDAVRCEDE